jgi:hypothetical protein
VQSLPNLQIQGQPLHRDKSELTATGAVRQSSQLSPRQRADFLEEQGREGAQKCLRQLAHQPILRLQRNSQDHLQAQSAQPVRAQHRAEEVE